MLKKLTAIVLIALLSVFCCVACAPEPVPPDMVQNTLAPEPVTPETAGNTAAPESTLVTETVPTDRVGARVALYDTSLLFWRREQAPALRCYSLIALPEPVPPDMAQNTVVPEPVPPETVGASPRFSMIAPSRPRLMRTREGSFYYLLQRAILESPLRCSNEAFNNDVAVATAEAISATESTPTPSTELFDARREKTKSAELGCSFAFFLLAVSAFSMMGALSVCNQPDDEF